MDESGVKSDVLQKLIDAIDGHLGKRHEGSKMAHGPADEVSAAADENAALMTKGQEMQDGSEDPDPEMLAQFEMDAPDGEENENDPRMPKSFGGR